MFLLLFRKIKEGDKDGAQKGKKKQVDEKSVKRSRKCLLDDGGGGDCVKRLYVPRLFTNKKTKFKNKNKKAGPLFFGPVVECK
jgi:hypothetical protein